MGETMKLLDRAKYKMDGGQGVGQSTGERDVAGPLRLFLVVTNALVAVGISSTNPP